MAQSSDIFSSKVKPIMDKVFADLQSKRADELEAKSTSLPGLMVGAAGPDGGMAAMDAYTNTVRMTGEWNSKTTEDYIAMVKKELKKQNIKVDAVMEKKMVDYLIKKEIPKSSAEYILKKAAEGTIFSLPQTVNRSALEDHIHNEAERRYDPSLIEVAASSILSWASNAATTMGIGGFWGQTATDVAVEGMNHVSNKEDSYLATQKAQAQKDYKAAEKKTVTIPKWMLTQMGFDRIGNAKDADLTKALKWATSNANIYRNKVKAAIEKGERTVKGSSTKADMSITDATIRAKQYEAFVTAIKKEQTERKTLSASIVTQSSSIAEASEETAPVTENASLSVQQEHVQTDSQQTQSSQDGWNNLIGSIGLEGVGDTMNHLGFTLANLPDMLLGIFTGKTKSIGMNQNLMDELSRLREKAKNCDKQDSSLYGKWESKNNYSGLNSLRYRLSISGSDDGDEGQENDELTNGNNSESQIAIGVPVYFYFKLNTNHLVDESQMSNLDEIAKLAKAENLSISISGAADSATGTEQINRELSKARAKFIGQELIKRGISKDKLKAVSRGGINDYTPIEANRNTCVIIVQ